VKRFKTGVKRSTAGRAGLQQQAHSLPCPRPLQVCPAVCFGYLCSLKQWTFLFAHRHALQAYLYLEFPSETTTRSGYNIKRKNFVVAGQKRDTLFVLSARCVRVPRFVGLGRGGGNLGGGSVGSLWGAIIAYREAQRGSDSPEISTGGSHATC
jgi:hypothetical protein